MAWTRIAGAVLLIACGARAVPGDSSSGVDTTGATTGAAPSCEALRSDDELGPSGEITVRSESAEPVWLDSMGCFFSPVLEVASDGQPVPIYSDDLIPGCDQYVVAGECLAGVNDCGNAFAGRMVPGGETTAVLSGAHVVDTVVDPACLPAPTCPTTCQRYTALAPGTYEVSITAYRTCSGMCDCDDPSDVCAIWSQVELGDPITITATIDYPTQTSAELVITDG